jgi:hypothetical protein
MSRDPGTRRVAAVLAELLVKGLIRDEDDLIINVQTYELAIVSSSAPTALRVARDVIPERTYDKHDSPDRTHHTWAGKRDDVTIRVTAVRPLGEPDLVDPLGAADEGDYLQRLIALGVGWGPSSTDLAELDER